MSVARDFLPFEVDLAGRNVVTASAGTGKTYAITALVVRLVVERHLDIRNVLVVTFTEAATAELRGRIRLRLRDAVQAYRLLDRGGSGDRDLDRYAASRRAHAAADRKWLDQALEHIDEAPISTIHGFCLRMLQEAAFESNARYETELVTDLGPLRDEVLHDAFATLVADQPDEVLERVGDALLPKQLRNLADKVIREPDLPVLGADPAGQMRAIVEQARALWLPDREAICREFEQKLKKQPQRATLLDWYADVDAYLGAKGDADLELPVGVRRLGGDGIHFTSLVTHPFFVWCRRLYDLWKRRAKLDPELVELKLRVVDYVRAEVPRRKTERGIVSFDDLLSLLQKALEGPTGSRLARVIRDQFPAALIDEFQDTDPVQLAIFDSIYRSGDAPVFLIGDPKQAIYSFRGADVFTYLGAVSKLGVRRHTMGVSYRSDPRLLAAVNAVFSPGPGSPPPFLLQEIDYPRVEPRPEAKDLFEGKGIFGTEPLDFLFVREGAKLGRRMGDFKSSEVPRIVAEDIDALLRSGSTIAGRRVTAGDVAVLTRSNKQCFEVQDELRRLRIPAVVLGDKSVFESREARELQRVLAAIVEPSRSELRRALASDLIGVSANRLAAMEEDATLWDGWVEKFREWGRLWSEKGFVQMFDAFLTGAKVPERLLGLVDGDRRMTNLVHLMELLRTAADERHLGPASLLHFLAVQRGDTDKRAEHAEIRLESDEAAVKLTTIHKSKGLEYPIVYCPYLWDGWLLLKSDEAALRFHDPEDGHRLKIDLGSADFAEHLDQAKLEALAENVRLLYVALTRARQRVTVLWGAFEDVEQSALGTLLHPPALGPDRKPTAFAFEHGGVTVDDAAAVKAIAECCHRSGGAVGLREVQPSTGGDGAANDTTSPPVLRVRERERPVLPVRFTASFSGLSRRAEVDPRDGKDHDDLADEPPAAPPTEPGRPIVLADFERGASAGTFYHSVLEHLDFRAPDRIEPTVDEWLVRSGYDVARYRDMVSRSVREVLGTELFVPARLRLGDVPEARRLNELEFHLPVADGKGAAPPSSEAFAEAFRAHPSAALPAVYADRVSELSFPRLAGFLKGFIDLVFEHEGRFYVVDYKTNFLGPEISDYGPRALRAAMVHGHYYLQYHLYSLAVHRYLGRRIPGYRYDEHFGGALYLFVRGMEAELPSSGVFFEKPPEARIAALSRLLDGAPGGSA